MMWYAGLDWADSHHDVVVIDDVGRQVASRRVSHSAEGLAELVNPQTIDRRRNASGAKTDSIDAYLLAKTGRSDLPDLRKLTPDSAIIQELKALTRDQDSLLQSQTRGVNQLTA